MIQEGRTGTQELVVTQQDTAAAMGSGTLPVLATPRLAALMEETAWKSLGDLPEEGTATVGTFLSLEHLAPTPVGGRVCCESVVTRVDGRELTFRITARDDAGVIARAEHRRVLIRSGRFLGKAKERTQGPSQPEAR